MSNQHSVPLIVDNDLMFLDVTLRKLNGNEEIAYHVSSRQNQFLEIHKRSRQFLSLAALALHFHITNSREDLPRFITEMLDEMKRIGMFEDQDYKPIVSNIMMLE